MYDLYFNKEGEPIDLKEWSRLRSYFDYRFVGQTYVGRKKNSKKRKMVSTIWLGINHSFLDGEDPVIFETMIFVTQKGKVDFTELYCKRYHTLAEASEGHAKAVKLAKTIKQQRYDTWEKDFSKKRREQAARMRKGK